MKVGVLGGSGFVGSAVVRALAERGHEVIPLEAPRLAFADAAIEDILLQVDRIARRRPATLESIDDVDVLVNAAGVADATSVAWPELAGANAFMPAAVQRWAHEASIKRFIHVSSAAVQGRRRRLDASQTYETFSPYSASKALGERALLISGDPRTCIFRPTSVQGANRPVTRALVRLASSPLAFVAGAGHRPTPQVLIENVADAVAFVADTQTTVVPTVVLQPSEGLTTGALLTLLGGKEPHSVPDGVAKAAVASGFWASRHLGRGQGTVRRLEMVLRGQAQEPGWLETTSWRPPAGRDAWERLRSKVNGAQ